MGCAGFSLFWGIFGVLGGFGEFSVAFLSGFVWFWVLCCIIGGVGFGFSGFCVNVGWVCSSWVFGIVGFDL